jgi:GTP pyrophosphokinase
MLDEFRRSFSPAYESVISIITGQLKLQPTGRPAKSTQSIRAKLKRESIRLAQIQDIAGCRIVVADSVEQDRVILELRRVFPTSRMIDRRNSPSHGYRAVHIIVDFDGRLIEIQIRSALQHLWAEFSEKLSDIADPAIKYGGGNKKFRSTLANVSDAIAGIEVKEAASGLAQTKVRPLRDETLRALESAIAGLAQIAEKQAR